MSYQEIIYEVENHVATITLNRPDVFNAFNDEQSYELQQCLRDATKDAEVRVGNALPLANIPLGTTVHNIELKPGKGAQAVRSAGAAAQMLAKEGDYVTLRMPSGEMRMVLQTCMATVGQVGNPDHANVKLGKAGRSRHLGIRPSVRGVAMDPGSHPHGGGEGRSPIGMPGPKTPWGKPARGVKTRHNKRTDYLIVRRRQKKNSK